MNAQPAGSFQVHSEARGPHWVAWVSRPGETGPYQSILLVGASREEAERKAREWASKLPPQMGSPSSSS
jgi:hypothetical protein